MSVLLRAEAISKSFGSVDVLQNVTFDLRPGEVHALLGENGAGKSTLLKILAGVHQADHGTIHLDDKPVTIPSPQSAQRLGIALIHQEPLSFPDLSVAENIFIGHESGIRRAGLIDWPAMYAKARELLESLGVSLDPRAKLRGLSIADQQMVELAAALSQNARVLLMDEPTASLTPQEVGDLFRIVRQLKARGTSIVFISHRLEEVFEISDRITVLRDGAFVGTVAPSETSTPQIIQMMVGRPLSALYEKVEAKPGETMLRVEGLTRRGRFEDISFDVKRGEIVGLAGLVGAGRTDVAQSIFGVGRKDAGSIWIDNRLTQIGSPRDAVDHGLAYVPEDRQHHGLLLPFTIAANTSLADLNAVSRLGWLLPRRERDLAAEWRDRLRIRLRDLLQEARELSGGNQQKVVLSKWLATNPQILILDEPTRGIDIGAKAEVHHLMAELARQGKSILMISSDLPEVLAMSDRILVMREGRLTGEFPRGATQEQIMSAATTAVAGSAHRKAEKIPATRSSRLMRFRELGIALFIALLVAIATARNHAFISPNNLHSILMYIPLIVVVAMGQMMVIISRNIDLSVGSVLGLSAIIVGNIFIQHPEFNLALAAITAAGVGAFFGFINGALVAWLRVPSIIATLGTLSAYRGLVFIYSNGRQVDPNYIPQPLIELSQRPAAFPWIAIFAGVVAIVTAIFMRYFRSGREIYAVGSNPTAARLRGLSVSRTLLLVFTATGALSGIAGLMYASRFGYVNPVKTGDAFELQVISAVILGGTNVFGGSGSVLGTVLGCLLLGVVGVALPVLDISPFWQLTLYGLAIVVAATVDTLIQRRTSPPGALA